MNTKSLLRCTLWLFAVAFAALSLPAEGLSPELQVKVEARLAVIRDWGQDPALVAAVQAANLSPDATLDNATWKGLSVLDPKVKALTKNPAADFLKSHRDEAVAEAFLSAANGTKVAFLNKPTNWTHAGKPKHEKPMAGEVWIGALEVDESTGQQLVQVAVPVIDGGKPIGSLVVGLIAGKLK